MNPQNTLGSTYRLQLAGLGFEGARQLVDYLSDFGIETLYVSPIFAAVPGSAHGYDVIDPTRLDPSLGTAAEFEGLLAELNAHNMRLLIDIVPNHMAVHPDNRWWWDTLRRGEDSPFADTFDIDWSRQHGRVLVPSLPGPLAEYLDSISFGEDDAERFVVLADQRFPLAKGSRTTSDVKALLARQHYRPAFWRLSNDEGNYRRFFDIDALIGVRVEDPHVFDRTHHYLGELASDARITGWRVDHIDGLTDPAEYLRRLRALAPSERRTPPIILVEKILANDEALSREWPVDGTTGYEFANHVGGLFVNEEGAHQLEIAAAAMTGDHRGFEDIALEAKGELLASSFVSPLERTARLAMTALDEAKYGHDLSWQAVAQAIVEITSHLDVYRTYRAANKLSDGTDRIDRALEKAASRSVGEVRRAIGLVAELFDTASSDTLEFVQRWQQLSGAVMAKAVEDTAAFRYSGLLSHADVGCDPGHPATTPQEFQRFLTSRAMHPQTLNATSTHDSKRSEDARARIFVLSEVPTEWMRLVSKWHRRYERLRSPNGPDAHDELVVYQSFVCLWPTSGSSIPQDLSRRLQNYVVKAGREAKRRTTWSDPNPRYERALTTYVSALVHDDRFRSEMTHFMDDVGAAAATNSLAMAVMKCVAPGVPDFYQGSELWDLALTDPDNRRPVDYERRRTVLSRLPDDLFASDDETFDVDDLLDHWPDGGIKLHVQRTLLRFRRAHSRLFDEGTVESIRVTGQLSAHIVSVVRRLDDHWLLSIVPRQSIAIAGVGNFATGDRVWGKEAIIRLPHGAPRHYVDVFTGQDIASSRGSLRVADCLNVLPVSVLVSPPHLPQEAPQAFIDDIVDVDGFDS